MSAQNTNTRETRAILEHEINSIDLPVSVVIGQTKIDDSGTFFSCSGETFWL